MNSDDEMAAAMMEDSCDDEDFYNGDGDGDEDSDPDSAVVSYDGLMDHDSDDFDDLSSSQPIYYHRSQVIFNFSLN